MPKTLMFTAGLLALALAGPVAAGEPQAPAAPTPPAAAAAPDAPATPAAPAKVEFVKPEQKKICKSITRAGTRTDTRRVCLTKEEWAEVTRGHREGAEALLRSHDNPNPPGL
jgi:molybdenum cofactor biosynthesis enzyme MoaA